jgi:predicted Zn-dependent protease
MATPAAPAQVATADPALGEHRVDDAAAAIAAACEAAARTAAPALTRLAGGDVAIAELAVEVVRERVDVGTSQGLHVRWDATEARVALLLVSGNRTTWARARARRRADLRLAELLATAAERLGGLAQAGPPPPGAYPVVLRLAALAPDDGTLGVWAGFAAQADAALVRHGLSRYRPGHPVADGAAADPEPLTITSDGTLPYGLASAPLGDQGEPVRRFVLVERGVARELAFDQREAGLAGERPNGGVRNLVVAPGATPAAALAVGGPVLDVASLAWVELDPRTAQLSAGVEYGTLRDGDRAQPITGAVIRGDAIAALAHGQRSADTAARGAYQGPIAIRTPPMDVS